MGPSGENGVTAGSTAAEPRLERVRAADGVNLAVRVWQPEAAGAAGAPFVLLPGLASTAVAWDGAARRLAAAGRVAYAIDLRGHGHSDGPDDGYELATFAADLVAAVAALGLERPILVGHSLGADVILEAVAGRPEIAAGVGLVEGGLVDARDQFAGLDECLSKTALPPVTGMPLPRLQGYLRASNPTWTEGRLAAAIAAFDVHADGTVSWRLTGARYEALLRALWEERVADLWPAVHVPTVVVAADTGDAPWTAAKRAAEVEIRRAIAGVRIEWLTADHDVHTDRPDHVADFLLAAFATV